MANVFWVQVRALIWKNWIVLYKRPFLNILRCFILPIAYGLFLANAQIFFNRLSNFGPGTAVPIKSLQSQFDGKSNLIWADYSYGHYYGSPTPVEVMERITANFTTAQRAAVKKVDPEDIFSECPQNYRGYTPCFAAVAFQNIPFQNTSGVPWLSQNVEYTIYGDWGLRYINVEKHTSDVEKRIIPLQWEIDSAIIELHTGIKQQTPLEWPFTQLSNENQLTQIRLSFLRGIRNIIGLAFFICFIGISYQLPGSFSEERALLLTEHMKAMGLLDSARYISWHIAISLAYLPAWIIVSLVWHFRLFKKTNVGLIILIHILLGLVLASYSFFTAIPFGKSPHLAAVVSTLIAIIFAILGLVVKAGQSVTLFVLSILFPPSFYMFALTALTGYENNQLATDILHRDPDKGVLLLPVLIAGIIDVFLWPYLAIVIERLYYDARIPNQSRFWMFGIGKPSNGPHLSANTAISVRNLKKVYKSPWFSRKRDVTAIEDLSLDIPKTGIFVLLGSNGAGKSTLLSAIAGISDLTSGTVTFPGGTPRPSRGTLGIVPQKNVLFPDLTCIQTLNVWQSIKWSTKSSQNREDLYSILRDCDLAEKADECAGTLSGGQKRKLQLAIGLVGGSTIVLVDECTSGVDPLSRRALWKTLTACREDRCVVFTTHFLDEADLMGDQIAILASPGKVVANGSPVALKRDLGQGYSIQVTISAEYRPVDTGNGLLTHVNAIVPAAYETSTSPTQVCYHLRTRDPDVMQRILELFDTEIRDNKIVSYAIFGTTIEDIFLDLMSKHDQMLSDVDEQIIPMTVATPAAAALADLPMGSPISPLQQAFTIFHKRLLVTKRSWLTSVMTIMIAICGACIPLIFMSNSWPSCKKDYIYPDMVPLYLPRFLSYYSRYLPFLPSNMNIGLQSPPDIIQTLGTSADILKFTSTPNNTTFATYINDHYKDLIFGGISIDNTTGASLVAWEATPPGYKGLSALNLATNVLFNRALNMSGLRPDAPRLISANYQRFPFLFDPGVVGSLRWMFYFGAAMAVYPAFFAMYVSRERRSSVQAMQFSNGLSNPIGLWLGHIMFDATKVVILSTVIIIVYVAAASHQLHGLGFMWFILVQYGITAALFAYCVSLFASSPLGAFAIVAGYQFVIFVLYMSSYFFIVTFAPTTQTSWLFNVVHFSTSILAPIASVIRAAIISVNLFNLLCDDAGEPTFTSLGSISKFGGPILYLFIYMFVLFAILVWIDSGSSMFWRRTRPLSKGLVAEKASREDVTTAATAVADSDDILRVLGISKSYSGKRVLDDVSLGVSKDAVFALLGPNGAGKTTTFNIIRGDVLPDAGDVFITGTSVIRDPRNARSYLGVCPQFIAIDSQLTVREHLLIYGRLKGLHRGTELTESVDAVLQGTALAIYADRLASKLSGGNQRKLSLAIALIGNPSVLLIDEFSTGIDPKMKRDMWQTLRRVAVGKAVVVTTHSMEEASALASNVAILAKRLLAVGTVDSLSSRYPAYEVHFTCRNREEVTKARTLMSLIPGSRMADDVATRFEVPITATNDYSLSKLFNTLSKHGDFTEYTVEKATLESVFIKVIRENNVREEQSEGQGGRRRLFRLC